MEADLVAHCGRRAEGAFRHTLVLTDVATGWTEGLPLLFLEDGGFLARIAHFRVSWAITVPSDDGKKHIPAPSLLSKE